MLRAKHKSLNQDGFASIVIALVLIIVLALLTVGFAQLARREQQTALDKQLATQAYDAAESGINDARSDIQNGLITTSTTHEGGTDCMTPSDLVAVNGVIPRTQNSSIDKSHGVSYSCLMVNLTPPNLSKTLDPGSAWDTVFKVVGQDNSDRALGNFVIQWSSPDATTAPPLGLPPTGTAPGQWGKAPALLEFSITPLCAPPAGGSCSLNRTMLESNSLTAYLHPNSSGGAALTYPADGGDPGSNINPYSDNNGQMIQAHCAPITTCTVTVTMAPGVGGNTGQEYLIHVTDYYASSTVSITQPRDTGGSPVYFANSQAVIDVTGKARQVLKRLHAVIPMGKTNPSLPSYGIEAQDLCKLLNTTIDTLPDGSPGGTSANTSVLPPTEVNAQGINVGADPHGACLLNN